MHGGAVCTETCVEGECGAGFTAQVGVQKKLGLAGVCTDTPRRRTMVFIYLRLATVLLEDVSTSSPIIIIIIIIGQNWSKSLCSSSVFPFLLVSLLP